MLNMPKYEENLGVCPVCGMTSTIGLVSRKVNDPALVRESIGIYWCSCGSIGRYIDGRMEMILENLEY